MKKTLFTASAIAVLLSVYSCKKSSSSNSSDKTVQNIAGTYSLTAITWTALGVSINLYDSLPACEKDNTIELKTDLTAQYHDAGVACDPAEDDHGNWRLSGDSIYLSTASSGGVEQGELIKTWDGHTLVLSGVEEVGPPVVTSTTTLVKK